MEVEMKLRSRLMVIAMVMIMMIVGLAPLYATRPLFLGRKLHSNCGAIHLTKNLILTKNIWFKNLKK